MRVFVQPYKKHSSGARKIAAALGAKKLLLPGKNVTSYDVIVNWGNHSFNYIRPHYINLPLFVERAANKYRAFEKLASLADRMVEWTGFSDQARDWLINGHQVVARHLLTSCEGKGIEICSDLPVPIAPLYTKYKKKSKEFRVHVFDGKVIDVQQKKRRAGASPGVDSMVRSFRNGWVFCREGIEEPEDLRDLAIKAVNILQLHFGAVDIIWNKHENKCYFLEVNTAPGIEGTTVGLYAEAIKAYLQKLQNAQISIPDTIDLVV